MDPIVEALELAAKLREHDAAMTPGEWEAAEKGPVGTGRIVFAPQPAGELPRMALVSVPHSHEDATGIVYLRNHASSTADLLTALTAKLQTAERERDEARRWERMARFLAATLAENAQPQHLSSTTKQRELELDFLASADFSTNPDAGYRFVEDALAALQREPQTEETPTGEEVRDA